MEVVYRLNEKDLLIGMRFMGNISPLVKRIKHTGVLLVAALLCLHFLVKSLAEKQFTLWNVINLVIELLLAALVYIVLTKLVNSILYGQVVATLKKKDRNIFGEYKVFLTEEELIELTSVSESRQKWSGIAGVYQNESHIIIMVNSQQGCIIPKRAFVSDDEANQFYNQASEFYQNSQPV